MTPKWGDGPRKLGNPIFKPASSTGKEAHLKNLLLQVGHIQRQLARIRKEIHNLQVAQP